MINEFLNSHQLKSDTELIINRMFNAPRDLVFSVWTTPEHVVKWWAPKGFTHTVLEMNVRPNGKFRFMLTDPDGVEYQNVLIYRQVVAPKLLSWLHGSNIPNQSGEFETTILFEKKEKKKTMLTIQMKFKTKEELEMVIKEHRAIERSQETMSRLEEYLLKITE